MQEKYSDENWGSQWIDLCDGKSELSKTINKISSDVGIKFNILRNHIISEATSRESSSLPKLKERIIKLFE